MRDPRSSAETREGGKILCKRANLIGAEVDDEPFGEDQTLSGPSSELGEELAAGSGVREVEADAFESAGRFFTGQDFFFVRKDAGEIGLDPP